MRTLVIESCFHFNWTPMTFLDTNCIFIFFISCLGVPLSVYFYTPWEIGSNSWPGRNPIDNLFIECCWMKQALDRERYLAVEKFFNRGEWTILHLLHSPSLIVPHSFRMTDFVQDPSLYTTVETLCSWYPQGKQQSDSPLDFPITPSLILFSIGLCLSVFYFVIRLFTHTSQQETPKVKSE